MADNYQEALLKAIDSLVSKRIDKIERDKTIVATIVSCTNALNNTYKVSYNNGFLTVYGQDGASYNSNQEVYVLVPEGDFSKKKIILGNASQTSGDENITFVSSLLNNYNMIGKNVVTDPNGLTPSSLHSYLKEEYILLYDRNSAENNYLHIAEDEFNNYIKNADALLIEASFLTRLPRAHRINKQGNYGIQFVLAFSDKDQPDEIKYHSYVLDTNSMTGNPLIYTTYTDQYAIFPIDTENFLYIDSILFFEQDFVSESDSVQADLWGPDIYVKDLEIYGLREIAATNGDYVLKIGTPQGATFTSTSVDEKLDVVASTTYQINTDISDSTTFYWFIKDDRVDSSSEYYQMYGGSGWKYLKDKGNNKTITVSAYDNRAYENKYLLVAVYKESVVLKDEFSLYNESSKRTIEITSDLGLKFSFDRGTPILTCLVNGKSSDFEEGKEDSFFTFCWSKIDDYGNTTPINKTYEELEQQYNDGIKNQIGYSALVAIKNQMLAMQGVEFDRNVLKYPIKQIDTKATFSCSVFMRENKDAEDFFIGSAQIVLQNDSAVQPADYYILIENGDQVFQYSESGVSPASERYTDPLEILPLECHFYDPAGLEINPETYSVQWKVPISDSLLVIPVEGMTINPSSSLLEIYTERIFPTDIKDSYDYQALNNQITCMVNYNGQDFQKETTFLFTKVGENGTNGTDVVCKISPVNEPKDSLFALTLTDGEDPVWNTGEGIGREVLKFEAYKRNELLNLTTVTWDISGGNSHSRYMSVENGDTYNCAIVSWKDSGEYNRNQIVRGTTIFESQTYYAFYPIPVIDYHAAATYGIRLDRTKTLKSITYNADGRNPLYNKNQGIFITLDGTTIPRYAVYEVQGGSKDNSSTAAIGLHLEKDSRDTYTKIGSYPDESGTYFCYITPNDIYDGAYCNNLVKVSFYVSDTVANQGGVPEVEVYIPIYMSLNTFGLASLNAWDGNHVEINEDENYILAPQIGAGLKDKNNRFTGVVMGKAQTYDSDEPTVGLLGYSEGKQSIFLDAETGNAIFGLPEDQASANNQYTEGRIELVPGGESKIGMWRIGSRALYNMTIPDEDEDVYIGVEPDRPYSQYRVKGAQISVPPEAQGLILNANPAYISVKGKPLTSDNSSIDWDGANTVIKEGDSLEIELDPSKDSTFSIYRHTTWDGQEDTGSWRRYPIVGINSNGQFYTNAVENGESQMGIGYIGAFGLSAADQAFVGGEFAYSGNNIFKFFIDESTGHSSSGQVYISAGTSTRNEYQRPISLHGATISLYSDDTASTSKITDHKITMDNDIIYIGHPDNYVQIPSQTGRSQGFKINTTAPVTFTFDGSSSTINNKNGFVFNTKTLSGAINAGSNSSQAISMSVTGNANISGFNYLTLASHDSYGFAIKNSSGSKQVYMGSSNAYVTCNIGRKSELYSQYGWNIQDKTGGINIISNSANGINISAQNTSGGGGYPYLSLVPGSGGTGDFVLSSSHGTVRSINNIGNGQQGVQITPSLSSGDAVFTGTMKASNVTCANTLTVGGKSMGQSWFDAIQAFYDKVNSGYDRLVSAFNSHTHNFSVSSYVPGQSYSGTAYYTDQVGSAYKNAEAGTLTYSLYPGSYQGDVDSVSIKGSLGVNYSGTTQGQTVTLAGTSSGPNMTV